NALLPGDIWVEETDEVALAFHPRFDAVARGYVYRVGNSPAAWSPFRRPWCWPLVDPLDFALLTAATETLLGEHSFRAFAKAGQPERGERCTIHRARWERWSDIGYSFE